MARIAGVDLPKTKRVVIGLTYIYGIGKASAAKICADAGVDESTRVNKLTEEEVKKIRTLIQNDYKVEGSLKAEINMNIKRLMDINSVRGYRHHRGLWRDGRGNCEGTYHRAWEKGSADDGY